MDIERDLESILIGDVGLNAASHAYAVLKLPEETLRWKKNDFVGENIHIIAEGQLVNHFLRLQQYMFCITITELRSQVFQFAELNHFPRRSNKDIAGRK